jgi:hypothetical protein
MSEKDFQNISHKIGKYSFKEFREMILKDD